jgi:hypothetical protein
MYKGIFTKIWNMIFANDMTFLLFFFSSLGELQYLNLESNSLDHLPKNLLHKNVHKKLLDVRLSYNKLRIVDTNTFSSLKVKLMTCFHKFSEYESTKFFYQIISKFFSFFLKMLKTEKKIHFWTTRNLFSFSTKK